MRSRAAVFTAVVLLALGSGCSKNNNSNPSGPGPTSGPAILTQLTSGPAFDVEPVWSPNGRTLAYTSDKSGVRTIWLLPDSGEAAPLLPDGDNADPQWSPDGNWVAFTSELAGHHNRDIWKIAATGGSPVQITHDTTDVSVPRWSPDGTRITYTSHFNGVFDQGSNSLMPADLWVVSADGGQPVQMTEHLDVSYPRWSPDGTKIAFVVDGGKGGIYTVDAAQGGAPFPLFRGAFGTPDSVTADTTYAGSPRWSPDGTKIAFTWLHGSRRIIGVVPVTGGVPTAILSSPSNQAGPEWSPDGNRIVFTSEIDGTSKLFVGPSAGGSGTLMTFSSLWEDFAPQWSPGGKKIVYVSQAGGDANLWLATFK